MSRHHPRQPPGGPDGGLAGPPHPRSTGLIIGIVVAAVVLVAAVGGIVMTLTGREAEPVSTIAPAEPIPPTSEPSPQPSPQPGEPKPTGGVVDLGHGVRLRPAPGWEVRGQGQGAARLSNGRDVYVGLVAGLPKGSNAGQACDSYHRRLAESYTDGRFTKPKPVNPGAKGLTGATCVAEVTMANGGGAITVTIFSLLSIRTDGLTVVGSMYFTPDSALPQLEQDFDAMVGSMLRTQAAG